MNTCHECAVACSVNKHSSRAVTLLNKEAIRRSKAATHNKEATRRSKEDILSKEDIRSSRAATESVTLTYQLHLEQRGTKSALSPTGLRGAPTGRRHC